MSRLWDAERASVNHDDYFRRSKLRGGGSVKGSAVSSCADSKKQAPNKPVSSGVRSAAPSLRAYFCPQPASGQSEPVSDRQRVFSFRWVKNVLLDSKRSEIWQAINLGATTLRANGMMQLPKELGLK